MASFKFSFKLGPTLPNLFMIKLNVLVVRQQHVADLSEEPRHGNCADHNA